MEPWLRIALAEGWNPAPVPALLDPARAPADLIANPPTSISARARNELRDPSAPQRSAALRRRAETLGLSIHTPDDDGYPLPLRELKGRPALLFTRGEAALLRRRPAITIVGSRTPTPYGEAAVVDFTSALARAGVAIWSGLAQGIDGLAHETALEHGAPTVAVLAGGLDAIEPRCHEPLAGRIVESAGTLLAESPPGLRPRRGHFPRRNRILAGSVDAVLVIEAGLRSGSLHTARQAADAGVDVFAVPGPYTSTRSSGCHALIAEGAGIAADPATLLDALGIAPGIAFDDPQAGPVQQLLRPLEQGPRPIELVRAESGLEAERFGPALLEALERGWLQLLPGDLLAQRSRKVPEE